MDEKENEHREKRKSTPNPRYSTDDYLLDFTTPERPPAVAKRTKVFNDATNQSYNDTRATDQDKLDGIFGRIGTSCSIEDNANVLNLSMNTQETISFGYDQKDAVNFASSPGCNETCSSAIAELKKEVDELKEENRKVLANTELILANQAERSKKRQKKPSLPYFHLNSEENLLDFCKRVDKSDEAAIGILEKESNGNFQLLASGGFIPDEMLCQIPKDEMIKSSLIAKMIELHPEPTQVEIITVNREKIKVSTSTKCLHPHFINKAYQGAHKRVNDKMRKMATCKVEAVVKAVLANNQDMEAKARKQCLLVKQRWESLIATADFKLEDEITNQLKKQRGKLENSVSAADAVVTP